ncbi:MAG: BrxE family protein [candidate division NC10 bacterium]|nr:BrxE family protein [candidate division NC10 bacterium]
MTRGFMALCIVIARAGCSDSFAWWEDESLTEAGLFSLKRLFPRTYEQAAVRLALGAARSRHDGILTAAGLTGAWHLFNLRDADPGMDEIPDPDSLPADLWSPIPDRSVLQARLETAAGPLLPLPAGVVAGLQGLIDLTNALRGAVILGDELAHRLAAAYLLGDRNRLVVPFVRRTPEHNRHRHGLAV